MQFGEVFYLFHVQVSSELGESNGTKNNMNSKVINWNPLPLIKASATRTTESHEDSNTLSSGNTERLIDDSLIINCREQIQLEKSDT